MKPVGSQFQSFTRDDIAVPGFLCIQGPSNRTGKSMHMIVGFAIGGVVELTGQLIAHWLFEQFGREFVVADPRDSECNIAIDAFHDKLNHTFAHHSPLIAIIASTSGTQFKFTCANAAAESVEFIAEIALVKRRFHGLTHSYVELNTGRVQVLLDNLPGELEFTSSGGLLTSAAITRHSASKFRRRSSQREASAWYGLGVCKGTPAEIIEKLTSHFRPAHHPHASAA
jgi:tripartite-type tricarboxylate transporter receptor subunit TctC